MDEHDYILLIYPVGNSDLNLDGEWLPRGGPFRHIVAFLLDEMTPDEVIAYDQKYPPGNDKTPTLADLVLRPDHRRPAPSFPICIPILQWIGREFPDQTVRVCFLLTDQPSRHPTDTIGFDRLVKQKLAGSGLEGGFRTSEVIRTNPADYDEMPKFFDELADRIEDDIAGASACYYNCGTGTPAMAFGAAMAFGTDARVTFLYKSGGGRDRASSGSSSRGGVTIIEAFRRLPRQRTLDLLDASLARFDMPIARELLEAPGNGFDPHDPATEHAVGRLRTLEAWQGELYGDAVMQAKAAHLTETASAACWLATRLERAPVDQPRSTWAKFWLFKLVDIGARLQIARQQGDVPGFLDRLRHFLDVSLLFGLACYGLLKQASGKSLRPDGGPAGLIRDFNYDFKTDVNESMRRMALLIWRAHHPRPRQQDMRPWLNQLLRLQLVGGGKLRQYRNQHIHATAELERNTLDQFVIEGLNLDPNTVAAAGGGAALLAALVLNTLEKVQVSPKQTAADYVCCLLDEYLNVSADLALSFDLTRPEESLRAQQVLFTPNAGTTNALKDGGEAIERYYKKGLAEQGAKFAEARDTTLQFLDRIAALPEAVPIDPQLAQIRATLEAFSIASVQGLSEFALIRSANSSYYPVDRKWLLNRALQKTWTAKADALAATLVTRNPREAVTDLVPLLT